MESVSTTEVQVVGMTEQSVTPYLSRNIDINLERSFFMGSFVSGQ